MITTLIFDFAGVLTTTRCFPKMASILAIKCGVDQRSIERGLYGNGKEYVLGNQSTYDFWKLSCAGLGISFEDFTYAFRTWYELDKKMLDYIRVLKKKYHIFLHSDNFDIITPDLRKNTQLQELFEQMFFSNEMHLDKKDENAFRYVLSSIKKKPEECVFIDDKEKNLVAPRSLGMHTIRYENLGTLKSTLVGLGVTE